MKALKNKGIFLTGKKVVILGAGGAARAISVECALAGAGFVTIINRTKERAKELASVLKHHTGTDSVGLAWEPRHKIPDDTDILINATSIGLMPDTDSRPDIDYHTITQNMIVCDVGFNPVETLFLKEAAAHHARTVKSPCPILDFFAVS